MSKHVGKAEEPSFVVADILGMEVDKLEAVEVFVGFSDIANVISTGEKLSVDQLMRVYSLLNQFQKAGMSPLDSRFTMLLEVLHRDHFLDIVSPLSDSPDEESTSSMDTHQLVRLKSQILAFRNLNRNVSIPPGLLRISNGEFQLAKPDNPILSSLQFTSGSLEENTKNVHIHPPPINKTYIFPMASTSSSSPSSASIPSNQHSTQAAMNFRIAELESLPPTLPLELRRRAELEIKLLKMLPMQKKIRAEVLSELGNVSNSTVFFNRDQYRKVDKTNKLSSSVDAKASQRIDRVIKKSLETHRKSKQAEFLRTVLDGVARFREFHHNNRYRKIKVNMQVVSWRANKERRLRLEKERREKERLRALRANDEEAYVRLLDETKEDRLMHLLEQTDSVLKSLGAKVNIEKGDVRTDNDPLRSSQGGETGEEEVDDPQTKKSALLLKSKKKYYSLAHAIKESVSAQPTRLTGGTLKSYQMEGLEWLVSLYNNGLNGVLADEMGLGKTVQTIALLTYLMEFKRVFGPHLIVVPLSTLSYWKAEFAKWSPDLTVVALVGAKDERRTIFTKKIQQGKVNVVVTTNELAMIDVKLLSKIAWDYLILDEGHRIKNRKSKLAITLSSSYKTRHRLVLTGTPLQNDLSELWSLLNFLLPKIFNSVDSFDNWFNAPFAKYSGTGLKPEEVSINEEEELLIINRLHHVLRPFLLRRVKNDVEKDLPPKTEVTLYCKLSAWQQMLHDQLQKSGAISVVREENDKGSGKVKMASMQNIVMQLRKVCNHPYLFYDWEEGQLTDEMWRVSGKFELLDRILPKLFKTGHRVLCFSQMKMLINVLAKFLEYRGYQFAVLDGSTKHEDRKRLIEEFNAPNSPIFIFLLTTRAGGMGINLQTADTVVMFDADWNPQMDIQAQARCHRIGQTKPVRVIRLVTGNSIEQTIAGRARDKLDIDAKVIKAGMFHHGAKEEDRNSMLKTLISTKYDMNTKATIPDDSRVNELIARSDEEIAIFNQMDKSRKNEYTSRLMGKEELPEWLTAEVSAEDIPNRGFGDASIDRSHIVAGAEKRKRSSVVLKDAILTENDADWEKLIVITDDEEEGEEGDEDMQHAKRTISRREEVYSPGIDDVKGWSISKKLRYIHSKLLEEASEDGSGSKLASSFRAGLMEIHKNIKNKKYSHPSFYVEDLTSTLSSFDESDNVSVSNVEDAEVLLSLASSLLRDIFAGEGELQSPEWLTPLASRSASRVGTPVAGMSEDEEEGEEEPLGPKGEEVLLDLSAGGGSRGEKRERRSTETPLTKKVKIRLSAYDKYIK